MGAVSFIETMDHTSLSNITQEEFEKYVSCPFPYGKFWQAIYILVAMSRMLFMLCPIRNQLHQYPHLQLPSVTPYLLQEQHLLHSRLTQGKSLRSHLHCLPQAKRWAKTHGVYSKRQAIQSQSRSTRLVEYLAKHWKKLKASLQIYDRMTWDNRNRKNIGQMQNRWDNMLHRRRLVLGRVGSRLARTERRCRRLISREWEECPRRVRYSHLHRCHFTPRIRLRVELSPINWDLHNLSLQWCHCRGCHRVYKHYHIPSRNHHRSTSHERLHRLLTWREYRIRSTEHMTKLWTPRGRLWYRSSLRWIMRWLNGC